MSESHHVHAPRVRRDDHIILACVLLGLVATVCVALGNWQLQRAQLRRDLQDTITHGQTSPALLLAADTAVEELHDWRNASAQGTWRNDLTVLIDNRNHAGKPGYWVATPLALDDGAVAILVLRGWLPRRFNGALPDVPVGHTDRVHGQLLGHVPRIYELPGLWNKHHRSQSDTMPVVTNLALDDFARQSGLTLLPAVLQQLSEDADGLARDWAGPSLDADKNVGYAIQWFSFAAIALGAVLVLLWRRVQRRQRP